MLQILNFNPRFTFFRSENKNLQKSTSLRMKPQLSSDTISFQGKKRNLEYYINEYGSSLPERVSSRIKEITDTLPSSEQPALYEIHDEVYAPLREAKTLEEAKKLFAPDFDDILPLSEIKVNQGILADMKKGKVEEPEGDAALHMLKCVYKQTDNPVFNSAFIYKNAPRFNIKPLKRGYASVIANGKVQNELWSNPAYREERSRKTKELWAQAEYRTKQEEIHRTPEFRQSQSETATRLWQDPEHQRAHSEAAKKLWESEGYREAYFATRNTPEFREKFSLKMKESWQDPERRAAMSEIMKEIWQDSEYIEKQKAARSTPEYSKAHSECLKKQWEDPEFREMITTLTKLSWENSDFVIEVMKELSQEHATSLLAYIKRRGGIPRSDAEEVLRKKFYKQVYSVEGTREARKEAYKIAKEKYERLKQEQ